jgi:hypothetical protein
MDSTSYNPDTEKVAVFMDKQTAERFEKFCENEQMFDILLRANIFGIKNGQAVINFNHTGTLMNVEIRSVAYQRGKDLT